MSSLLGANIGTNYKGIINIGSTINQNVSSGLQSLTDGDGNNLPIQVSTTQTIIGGGTSAGRLVVRGDGTNPIFVTENSAGTFWRVRITESVTEFNRTDNAYPSVTINNGGLIIHPNISLFCGYIASSGSGAGVGRIQIANSKIIFTASVTARASLNIPSGVAPTTPENGDMWFDGTNLKMRVGGVTKTFTLV